MGQVSEHGFCFHHRHWFSPRLSSTLYSFFKTNLSEKEGGALVGQDKIYKTGLCLPAWVEMCLTPSSFQEVPTVSPNHHHQPPPHLTPVETWQLLCLCSRPRPSRQQHIQDPQRGHRPCRVCVCVCGRWPGTDVQHISATRVIRCILTWIQTLSRNCSTLGFIVHLTANYYYDLHFK